VNLRGHFLSVLNQVGRPMKKKRVLRRVFLVFFVLLGIVPAPSLASPPPVLRSSGVLPTVVGIVFESGPIPEMTSLTSSLSLEPLWIPVGFFRLFRPSLVVMESSGASTPTGSSTRVSAQVFLAYLIPFFLVSHHCLHLVQEFHDALASLEVKDLLSSHHLGLFQEW
jgi:hypothetical protein